MKPNAQPSRIGHHLCFLRKTRTKLSQAEVANRIDVDRNTYARWESGLSDIKAEYLPRIAEIFGVPVAQLFDLSANESSSRLNEDINMIVIYVPEEKLLHEIIVHVRIKVQ